MAKVLRNAPPPMNSSDVRLLLLGAIRKSTNANLCCAPIESIFELLAGFLELNEFSMNVSSEYVPPPPTKRPLLLLTMPLLLLLNGLRRRTNNRHFVEHAAPTHLLPIVHRILLEVLCRLYWKGKVMAVDRRPSGLRECREGLSSSSLS